MKRIYCDIRLFTLEQNVYIVNPATGDRALVASATLEELPEVISAISNDQSISKVLLTGNSIFGQALAEDILAYSHMNYNWNNIEVEVLK